MRALVINRPLATSIPLLGHSVNGACPHINQCIKKTRAATAAWRTVSLPGPDTTPIEEIRGAGSGRKRTEPDQGVWFSTSTAHAGITYIGTDTVGQILKEFWPDIRRKLFK